jgi:hypothetical protein
MPSRRSGKSTRHARGSRTKAKGYTAKSGWKKETAGGLALKKVPTKALNFV